VNSGEPKQGYWTECDARIAAETAADRACAAELNAANALLPARPLGTWQRRQRRATA
jgi:hypothetical protein